MHNDGFSEVDSSELVEKGEQDDFSLDALVVVLEVAVLIGEFLVEC